MNRLLRMAALLLLGAAPCLPGALAAQEPETADDVRVRIMGVVYDVVEPDPSSSWSHSSDTSGDFGGRVDEAVAFGGLDELESYAVSDIYLMEVYSRGTEIRVLYQSVHGADGPNAVSDIYLMEVYSRGSRWPESHADSAQPLDPSDAVTNENPIHM